MNNSRYFDHLADLRRLHQPPTDRVVCDSNIFIKAFLCTDHDPIQEIGRQESKIRECDHRLFLQILNQCKLCMSKDIMDEVERVLLYKLKRDKNHVSKFLGYIQDSQNILVVNPFPVSKWICAGNEPDKKILGTAAAANAGYLITRDKRHLLCLGSYQSTLIVDPLGYFRMTQKKYIRREFRKTRYYSQMLADVAARTFCHH